MSGVPRSKAFHISGFDGFGLGFRGSGARFRVVVPGFGYPISGKGLGYLLALGVRELERVPVSGQDLGFRVSSFGLRFRGLGAHFWVRVSGFRYPVSSWDFGYPDSGWGFGYLLALGVRELEHVRAPRHLFRG